MTRFAFILGFMLLSLALLAEERKVAFGMQIEPIIPSALFRITTDEVRVGDILFTAKPVPGFTYGAFLSFNINSRFSVETGINHLSRDYRVSVNDQDFSTSVQFRVVNFEMPLALTYYVRLGRKFYMGHTAGLSMQFLPSHLKAVSLEKDAAGDRVFSFEQISTRRYWLMPAFKGNIGIEYRSDDHGYFYIGPSYRLFTVLYRTQLYYFNGPKSVDIQNVEIKPIGDYFGITIRYVFPPSERIRPKKKD